MSEFRIERFGHIVYSPDLSYHDLLDREEQAKAKVQEVLEKASAEFIHFEALGDMLRFQCVLPEEDDKVFHAICDDLAPFVTKANGLDARLLLVDKDLTTVFFYSIVNGKWQEATVGFPPAGYIAPKPEPVLPKPKTNHAEAQINARPKGKKSK